MASRLDYERVASIIVEAIYNGDADTCKRWDISQRSLQRYRKLTDTNDALSGFVALKLEAYQDDWIGDVASAIRAGADFVKRASKEADASDAETIKAVGEALKVLTDAHTTARIVNERIRQTQQIAGQDRPELAASSGDDPSVIDGEVIEDGAEQTEPNT